MRQHVIRLCENEIEILSRLRARQQEYFTQLYGYTYTPSHTSIAMEYMLGGSMDVVVHKAAKMGKIMPEHDVRKIAKQLIKGLDFLHNTCHIYHRDIKLANILIKSWPKANDKGTVWHVKIGDFGLSEYVNDLRDIEKRGDGIRQRGTGVYFSPEHHSDSWYKRTTWDIDHSYRGRVAKADVWALGVSVYEIMTGTLPFDVEEGCDIVKERFMAKLKRKIHDKVPVKVPVDNGQATLGLWQPPKPKPKLTSLRKYAQGDADFPAGLAECGVSPLGIRFVQGLLKPDSQKRWTAGQALWHGWVTLEEDRETNWI
ncbi:kinase-like domain-containing protein [Bombardia bombarda]|uniref:Autophagy-related protein 1 n=1 Tax=Bombardia bombarda TaxID=252184 RepID=A0AA39XBG5_9PEZI|nr:kinase-like domain-containing protein [Bombardia bombarda]